MVLGHARRCSCLTTANRKCKLPFSFMIQDKKFCYIHASMLFGDSSIIIQRIFLGWKLRQKMEKIYMRLPDEIQRKIMWHVRESHYLEKHHYRPIRGILMKRDRLVYLQYFGSHQIEEFLTHYSNLVDVYQLYLKYIEIINSARIIYLLDKAHYLMDCINKRINSEQYYNIEDNLGELITLKNKLWEAVYELVKKYEQKHYIHPTKRLRILYY